MGGPIGRGGWKTHPSRECLGLRKRTGSLLVWKVKTYQEVDHRAARHGKEEDADEHNQVPGKKGGRI